MLAARRFIPTLISLVVLLSSFLPSGGFLSPIPTFADQITYPHTFSSPYDDAHTSQSTFGGGWARTSANRNTGYIGASSLSYVGCATAEATQRILVNHPAPGLPYRFHVHAQVIYAGGTQKFGCSASAWGATYKVWRIGDEYYKDVLDPAFGWDDVAHAAVDLALIFASAGVELAGVEVESGAAWEDLTTAQKIAKLIDYLGYCNDAENIAEGFYSLLEAQNAERFSIDFSFNSTGSEWIDIGFRTDTSGCLLGTCYAVMVGLVESVEVTAVPLNADGYWSFDNWTGGDPIWDDSGRGHAGHPYNGPTAVPGKISGGIHFDGVDDWVKFDFDSAARAALARQGTFELWVKPEEVRSAHLIYGGHGGGNGFGTEKEIHLSTTDTGRFSFYLGSYAANEQQFHITFGSYQPGQWYHLAVSYYNFPGQPMRFKLYLNGNLVDNHEWILGQGTASLDLQDLRLGRPNASERYFKGVLDEVKVYGWRLTDEEVQEHYRRDVDLRPPTTPVLVQDYPYTGDWGKSIHWEPSSDDILQAGDGLGQVAKYKVQWTTDPNNWPEDYYIHLFETKVPYYTFQNAPYFQKVYYRVKAVDWRGRESGWSNVCWFFLDPAGPEFTSFNFLDYCSAGEVQGDEVSLTLHLRAKDTTIYNGQEVGGSGLAAYQISLDGSTWETYHLWEEPPDSPITQLDQDVRISIPYQGDGWRSIWLRFMDAAGNLSQACSDSTYIDTTPPTGAITIENDAEVTSGRVVTLNLQATDEGSGPAWARFRNEGEEWTEWKYSSVGWYDRDYHHWVLPEGEGEKTVYVQFKDGVGHISPEYSDTINYVPVSGNISINNGAEWTTSKSVSLDLSASETADQMKIWNDGEAEPSEWESYQSSVENWTLSGGDGVKTVHVKFRDSSTGEESEIYSDSINLDSAPPTGQVVIENWPLPTNSSLVTLHISAEDNFSGVGWMRFRQLAETQPVGEWTPWEVYSETRTWHLLPGEGWRGVQYQFKDRAGNISRVCGRQLRVDLSPPEGSVRINDGAEYTNSTSVTLDLSITGQSHSLPRDFSSSQGHMGWYYYQSPSPGTYIQLSWDNHVEPWGDQAFYSWNPNGAEPRYLQITGPDQGARIQTGHGYNVAIGWRAPWGAERTVRGELWATAPLGGTPAGHDDGVYFSIYKNDELIAGPIHVFHNAELQHGVLEVTISLDMGDMVYFYIDRGNWQDCDEVQYHFTITGPEGTYYSQVRFANVLPPAITFQDLLLLLVQPEAYNLLEQEEKAARQLEWSDWESFADVKQWEIPPGDGTKTVLVQFKDAAGNVSSVYRASICLDQTPPTGTVIINGGALETSSRNPLVEFSANDNLSGVSEFMAYYPYGSWFPYRHQRWYTTLWSPGVNRIGAIFKDRAGNVSEPCWGTILYDPLFTSSRERLGSFSNLELADLNGDGQLDILAVGLGEPYELKLFLRQDRGFRQARLLLEGEIENVYRPMLGDIDRDGDLDLIVLPRENIPHELTRVYLNEGQFIQVAELSYALEGALGDINNDGALDLILSKGESTQVFLNKGNFVPGQELPLRASSLALGDVDGDGDEDLLLGHFEGEQGVITLFSNEGGQFSYRSDVRATGDSKRFPIVLLDLDGDQDLDLLSGGRQTEAWLNDGSGNFSPVSGTPFADKASCQILAADVNHNGQPDLILGEPSGELCRVNLGFSWGELGSDGLYPIRYECRSSPLATRGIALGDMDGDGDLDMVLGQLVGFPSEFYRGMPSSLILLNNTGPNPSPEPPSDLQAEAAPGQVLLSWGAGSDDSTPPGFLTYNLRVGTRPRASDVLSGAIPAGPGNLGPHRSKLLYLPSGTYYWSVQTVDAEFARSGWAPEQSFTVPDTIPPAAVSDLHAGRPTSDSVPLDWTAPGDDGNAGTAFQYDIRFSTSPITEENWDEATPCVGEPPPSPAGSHQEFTVYGLSPKTTYYFALKTADEAGNWSGLSNQVEVTTMMGEAPPPPSWPPPSWPPISDSWQVRSGGGVSWDMNFVNPEVLAPYLPGVDLSQAIAFEVRIEDLTPGKPDDANYCDIVVNVGDLDVNTCRIYKVGQGFLPEVENVNQLPLVSPPGEPAFCRDMEANQLIIRLYVGDPLVGIVPQAPPPPHPIPGAGLWSALALAAALATFSLWQLQKRSSAQTW